MPKFTITVTFLNGTFHGRRDNSPEWPPSPMRLFQALVAVAGTKWQSDFPIETQAALDWLSTRSPPEIFAPKVKLGIPYRAAVPNNAGDIWGNLMNKGSTSDNSEPAKHKAMKEIAPTYLLPDPNQGWNTSEETGWQVSYLWDVKEAELSQHLPMLQELASCLYEVGWGLDLVAGFASDQPVDADNRQVWRMVSGRGTPLRSPRPNARIALQHRHSQFLNRIAKSTLVPVAPLSSLAYDIINYRTTDNPSSPTFAAFSFLETDGSRQHSFGLRKSMQVAGMLRHAAKIVATNAGWDAKKIAQMVMGHLEDPGEQHAPVGRERFSYVPLPSLETRDGKSFNHVGMIRRALLFIPSGGHADEVNVIRRLLSGMELMPKDNTETAALITALPTSDKMIQRYVPKRGACTWSTVTPVILPGRDDRKEKKTERLLRKCIVQAGYSQLLADHAILDWRPVGYRPGAEHVKAYQGNIPKHLKNYPRYHVKITWRQANNMPVDLHGPVVLGGGRYYGLGLFAAEDSQK